MHASVPRHCSSRPIPRETDPTLAARYRRSMTSAGEHYNSAFVHYRSGAGDAHHGVRAHRRALRAPRRRRLPPHRGGRAAHLRPALPGAERGAGRSTEPHHPSTPAKTERAGRAKSRQALRSTARSAVSMTRREGLRHRSTAIENSMGPSESRRALVPISRRRSSPITGSRRARRTTTPPASASTTRSSRSAGVPPSTDDTSRASASSRVRPRSSSSRTARGGAITSTSWPDAPRVRSSNHTSPSRHHDRESMDLPVTSTSVLEEVVMWRSAVYGRGGLMSVGRGIAVSVGKMVNLPTMNRSQVATMAGFRSPPRRSARDHIEHGRAIARARAPAVQSTIVRRRWRTPEVP